jgi:hypothetical protein
MQLSQDQLNHIVSKVFKLWKENQLIQFKADEKKVFERAVQALKDDLKKEMDLEREAHSMIDKLEAEHGGSFQRHKMFTMLKQKLAKEKKVIL